MNKLKSLILKIAPFLAILIFAFAPVLSFSTYGIINTAHAVDCSVPPKTTDPADCTPPATTDSGLSQHVTPIETISQEADLADVIVTVINWILLVVGTVAVLMLIYGGFRYVTSAGNQDQLETAKTVITYAIVGLIVILIAFVIVTTINSLVLNNPTTPVRK